MPNELCRTCGKEKCSTPSDRLHGPNCKVNVCHGNCHPDDSGKVCEVCDGRKFLLDEWSGWDGKVRGKRTWRTIYEKTPCPSCSPSTKTEGKRCCDLYLEPCPLHTVPPTPSDKDGEDWEVSFDERFTRFTFHWAKDVNAGEIVSLPSGIHDAISYKEDIKRFIRTHLQHQRILGRREQHKLAVEAVKSYSAKYRRYLKDAKQRSDLVDMCEFAHKDSAADEILYALQSVSPDI